MKKLMLLLILASFVISVPVAFAKDLNWNGLRQNWRDQVNLEKQQKRVWGLVPEALKFTVPDTTQPATAAKQAK
ncbi:MAG: hypothetical protein HY913_00345 [Desulfomonile tiedjei]|nr:hypothetical protein [Desulfomonile tiedjei]